MSDATDPATDRLVLATCAAVLLVLTAGFLLPATVDVSVGTSGPGIDLPGADAGESPDPGGGETVTGGAGSDTSDGSSGGGSGTEPPAERDPLELTVTAPETRDHLVPGHEMEVEVVRGGDAADADVFVDGDVAGETDDEGVVTTTVPGTETATVAAESPDGASVETEVDVRTDLDVRIDGPVGPGERVDLHASVGDFELRGADVLVDGEERGTTDEDGTATPRLPTGVDSTTFGVAYGELSASETVEFDLEVTVESPPIPVAGLPATVSTRYGEYRAADVDVYVAADDRTGDVERLVAEGEPVGSVENGTGYARLPAASAATIAVTDGQRTDAVAFDGLLRNLAIGVLLGLSLVGGLAITTLRALRWIELQGEKPSHRRGPLANLVLAIGSALLVTVGAVGGLFARLHVPRLPRPSLPALGWPSLPRLRLPSFRLPSFGAFFASLGTFSLPSLSLPSFGGVSMPSLGRSDTGGDDASASDTAATDPFADEADDAAPQLSERELVRAAIRDLARLAGVRRVETNTPGQIRRRAVDRALPREPVRAIVRAVREVEYGGHEATTDHASRVRRAVRRLRDAVREETDDQPPRVADGGEDA